MEEKPAERRLAAVLHADVAGYSRLMGSDEEATVRAVRAQRGIVEGVVRQHRGRLADFTGDAFLAEFPSAVDAVSAALSIQRESAVLGAAQPEERRFRLRIGVHAGDVRVDAGAIYGDAIHVAARLQTLAEPGGVCLSATVREQLAGKLPLRVHDLGPQTLKTSRGRFTRSRSRPTRTPPRRPGPCRASRGARPSPCCPSTISRAIRSRRTSATGSRRT